MNGRLKCDKKIGFHQICHIISCLTHNADIGNKLIGQILYYFYLVFYCYERERERQNLEHYFIKTVDKLML